MHRQKQRFQSNNCEADTMNKSELFKSAHKLAKEVIQAGDNYRVTFGACIKAVLSGFKKEVVKTGVSISTFNGNFLVKVPYALKDAFKKAVKGAKWCPETKEWFVSASKEKELKAWATA